MKVTKSLEQFRKEGERSGRNWKDSYRPGGPWVCKGSSVLYADLRERTRKENQIWHEGFADGLKLNSTSPLGALYVK